MDALEHGEKKTVIKDSCRNETQMLIATILN